MTRKMSGLVNFTFVLLVMLISGCGGLSRITLDPGTREQLKSNREILVVHYHPWTALPVHGAGGFVEMAVGATSTLPLEDPLLRVKDRFIHDVSAELGISSFRMIQESRFSKHIPAKGADIGELQKAFGTGMVIDFDTIAWQLTFVSRSFVSSDKTTYGLDYTVRARLIRLDDSKILWQGFCVIQRDRNPQPWGELAANDFSLLRVKRLDTADACAQELVDYFLGRASWSFWTGRTVHSPGK
jgi:hypothetical protein